LLSGFICHIFLAYVFSRSRIPVSESPQNWTFLSNYAHVLVCLADNPDARLRDVAERVGITERTAFRLIGELEEAGVLERAREGRRNHYVINTDAHLRHAIEEHCTVGNLLETILNQQAPTNN
jgi:DNA-binding MarR family transcriptional regulator